MNEATGNDQRELSMALLRQQRSHVLFVLSNAKPGSESAFLDWYRGRYRDDLIDAPGLLKAQHYEQHEVDITLGRYGQRVPFRYLGIYELSVDGAEAASSLIDRITGLHQEQVSAEAPATWLYYPASEKVGRSPPPIGPSMLVIAFANGIPGQESEFREWYATRHIRHALNISVLVSGQCFQRTHFQQPGAMECLFDAIAAYEQVGTAEAFIESHASLPRGTMPFPMLDLSGSRFSEWLYRPV
jgi:hypothetical protein